QLTEPRQRYLAKLSGLDVHYDLGPGHPLLGRRMPDLDLVTADGPRRVFELLHRARPLLLDLGPSDALATTAAPCASRISYLHARYDGPWVLPVLGTVAAPSAVLVRPDGYLAWVGAGTNAGLREALSRWFGPPAA